MLTYLDPLKFWQMEINYLCVTDAFTKYVQLMALPNKEAATFSSSSFNHLIYRLGVPAYLITDQVKEFCEGILEDLCKQLGTSHLWTTAGHLQINSQAEIANRNIAKHLSKFVNDTTLEWEQYLLSSLIFSYNTSFHQSIPSTPIFLNFGLEPQQPGLPTPDLCRKFYGDSNDNELHQHIHLAINNAQQHNKRSTTKPTQYANQKTSPHPFQPGQLVLLDEHSFLHKNKNYLPNGVGHRRPYAW
jgi:hypothetical protein